MLLPGAVWAQGVPPLPPALIVPQGSPLDRDRLPRLPPTAPGLPQPAPPPAAEFAPGQTVTVGSAAVTGSSVFAPADLAAVTAGLTGPAVPLSRIEQACQDLLARTRPRQPLNGVIVAIPAVEVAGAPAALRRAHAQAIRDRIGELDSRLGARLPVYMLFTKADLIAGFTEFFDDLDAERRGQVWGTTFLLPPRGGAHGGAPTLDTQAAFAGLVARLDTHVAGRLQAERSPERRVLIAGFPTQVASLAEPLATFVTEAFGGSKLRPAPLLRGFYLASGTQEGTPVDRLTGLLSRAFGVDQRRAASLRPVRGRSLFLHRLLAGVLPGEAMLVRAGPQAVRRGRAARAAGLGGRCWRRLPGAGWCGGCTRRRRRARRRCGRRWRATRRTRRDGRWTRWRMRTCWRCCRCWTGRGSCRSGRRLRRRAVGWARRRR